MTQEQLREFFRAKREHAQPAALDLEARRDTWIGSVEALYQSIEQDYLSGVRSELQFERSDKEVTEPGLGRYAIAELTLKEQVIFSPKGANIVGAQGRIDVRGERGDATLVWQGDNQWSLVVSRTPKLRLIDLNAESLGEMLRGIMRP